MKKFLLYLAPFFLFFLSCEEKKAVKSTYYPIDSLISAQVKFLTASKASLSKRAEINGEAEVNQFIPSDTSSWKHELEIFAELETINKPIYRGSYKIENGLKDTNSNLTILSFTSNTKLPVTYLKIFYLNSPSELRRIEAIYQNDNALLTGSRHLVLEFQEIDNKIGLTSYSIEGGQKMILGNPVQFSVKGTITLP